MTTEMKRILFASDLSENAKMVFSHAVSLSNKYRAGIIILHVMETLPTRVDNQLSDVMGKDAYQDLRTQKKESARNILINKRVDMVRVKAQLSDMHQFPETDMQAPQRLLIENIIVEEGDVAEAIAETARENECDVIVMGSPDRGLLAEKFAGSIVRKVLRRAKRPVFLVPV